uniref:Ubiquitin carboxyl-terminal hydrolase n=2 Tax=Mesocestoides corti TaxID=53468 RepID=A0A5K3ELA3_MESCO
MSVSLANIGEQQRLFDECFYNNEVVKAELVDNDRWFIISWDWFNKWRTFIRRSHPENGSASGTEGKGDAPGPIDMSSIMCDGDLKPNLILNADVIMIPEALLDKLILWYGLVGDKSGIPSRKVYLTAAKELSLDLYPPKLILTPKSSGLRKIVAVFNSKDSIGNVKEEIRKENKLHREQIITLYDAQNKDKLPDNVDATLTECSLDGTKELYYEVGPSRGLANGDGPSGLLTYSESRTSSLPVGVCGLGNLGNTCFMNSAIQCISNVAPLRDYFLTDRFKEDINAENKLGSGGEIAEAFAELIHQMWDENNRGRSCVPRSLKFYISKTAPQFAGYQQHDAQELMNFLLDFLNEDLNKVKQKPYIEVRDADGRPDEVVAAESWSNFKKRNDSIVVDLFYGLLKSTVICPECNYVSVTFDPFGSLSLPLPNHSVDVFVWPFTRHTLYVPPGCRITDILTSLKRVRCLPAGHEYVVARFINNNNLEVIPRTSNENLYKHQLHVFDLVKGSVVPVVLQVNGRVEHRPFLISLENYQPRASKQDVIRGVRSQLSAISAECEKQFEDFANSGQLKFIPDGEIFEIDPEKPILIEMPQHLKWNFHEDTEKHHVRLADCLDLFLATEQLSDRDPWYCTKCKEHRQAFKKFDIWSLPRVLVIHLKRYRNGLRLHKNETFVSCPETGLEVTCAKGKFVYDLVAVSNHMGGVGGGHYTAYAKNGDAWYNFDDSFVSKVNGPVVTRNAYFLVYMLNDATSNSTDVCTNGC